MRPNYSLQSPDAQAFLRSGKRGSRDLHASIETWLARCKAGNKDTVFSYATYVFLDCAHRLLAAM